MEFGVVLWSVEWTFWSDIVGVILLEWYCGVWSGRFGVVYGVILWSVEWTFWSGIVE